MDLLLAFASFLINAITTVVVFFVNIERRITRLETLYDKEQDLVKRSRR